MPRSALAMLATLALATAACGKGPAPAAVGGTTGSVRTRVYYIAADEVVWDYAPTGTNQIEGRPFNDVEKTFMEPGKHAPGRKEMKALYREYTDSSFTRLKPRTPEWEHLGFLGPLIRGEVGDTINVVFRNNARFKASLHPHGVFYNKDSEGALYNDGTTGADKSDDGVPQGETHTYVWQVSERAGPPSTTAVRCCGCITRTSTRFATWRAVLSAR
jgi:FtsP/CotA-like multicopper oxidase with cupredoxin domain